MLSTYASATDNAIHFTDEPLPPYIEKSLYLSIRPREPSTLGIGVGGNIIQDIEKDDNDPRLWDIANSKFLFIHLLEASTCESILGPGLSRSPIARQYSSPEVAPIHQSLASKGKNRAVEFDSAFDGLE